MKKKEKETTKRHFKKNKPQFFFYPVSGAEGTDLSLLSCVTIRFSLPLFCALLTALHGNLRFYENTIQTWATEVKDWYCLYANKGSLLISSSLRNYISLLFFCLRVFALIFFIYVFPKTISMSTQLHDTSYLSCMVRNFKREREKNYLETQWHSSTEMAFH